MFPTSNTAAAISRAVLGTCALAVLLLTGCDDGSVDTYSLSGEVTYQGKPVPRGYIIFEPNKEAGNSGPGAQVEIRDGRFTTLEGNGTIGGPHKIRMYGYDGVPVAISIDEEGNAFTSPLGSPLFTERVLELDLPREPAEQNLEVPAE